MIQRQRLIWADSLKGVLMILVILGHAIQTNLVNICESNHLWNLIYSFHMPAFMAVSGWFAYRNNKMVWIKSCKKRACQLLVPYIVWSLISFVLHGNYTLENLSNIIVYPDKFFWFLWVLFWINIIFTVVKCIADKMKIDEMIPIGIACILMTGVMMGLEIRVFGFQFLAYYFIYYTLGYCIHRFYFLQISKDIILITMIMLWGGLAWFWNMHELPSWMPTIPYVPTSLVQYAYRGFTAFVAVVIILAIAPKMLNSENKFSIHIKEIGVFSLGLYVCHLSFMEYIVNIVRGVIPASSDFVYIFVTFIVSFVSSLIIVEFLKKYNWTAKVFLGKIKK